MSIVILAPCSGSTFVAPIFTPIPKEPTGDAFAPTLSAHPIGRTVSRPGGGNGADLYPPLLPVVVSLSDEIDAKWVRAAGAGMSRMSVGNVWSKLVPVGDCIGDVAPDVPRGGS